MSEVAYAELEMQVESLPMFQLVMLKNKIESIVAKNAQSGNDF